MSVLLPTNEIILFAPDIADDHGWTLPPEPIPVWVGQGSVQLSFGTTGTGADQTGGSGPFKPNAVMTGTGYLPPEAKPRNGMLLATAEVGGLVNDGQRFVVSGCRFIPDPTRGSLDCWAVTLTASGVTDVR